MGNAYYGRRRAMMPNNCGVAMPYTRRTAAYCEPIGTESTIREQDCDDMVLAMAYVPVQQWNTLFEIETGFDLGTVFPELEKPFMRGGCSNGV